MSRQRFIAFIAFISNHPIRSLVFCLTLTLFVLCLHHLSEGPKPWETKWLPYPETPEARSFSDHFKAWKEGFGTRENGKLPGFKDYFETGMWFGALINSILLGILLLTTPFWLKPTSSPTQTFPFHSSPHSSPFTLQAPSIFPRWTFSVSLALIVLVALYIRLPLMTHSLWGDEEWAFRKNVHGLFVTSDYNPKSSHPTLLPEKAPLTYQPIAWERTFFYDKDTNNHYLFSILQRGMHEVWQKVTGAPDHAFSEPVLRIIPLLFCIILFLVLPITLYRHFGWRAAILSAILLAISPWHMRYSTEARGYGMLFTFLMLHVIFLLRAIRIGTWKRWSLAALTAFLSMYTWKGALFPLLPMHLVVAGMLFYKQSSRTPLQDTQPPGVLKPFSFLPWFVTHAFAAAAFLQLFAPCHPQIKQSLRTTIIAVGEPMNMHWLKDQLSHLLYGIYAIPTNKAENDIEISLSHLWEAAPFLTALTTSLMMVFIVLGIFFAWQKNRTLALLLFAPLMGALLQAAYFKWGIERMLLFWYIVYLLPFLIIFHALGLLKSIQFMAGAARRGPLQPLAWFVGLIYIAILFSLLSPVIHSLRIHPRENYRAAAALSRPDFDPHADKVSSSSSLETFHLWRHAPLYDPYAYTRVRNSADLHHFLTQAKALNKKVRFTLGHRRFQKKDNPKFFGTLKDPQYFKSLGMFLANKDMFSLEVLEWTGKIPPELSD